MLDSSSSKLVEFATNLKFDDIPDSVVLRIQWLFLDWYGSALAGSDANSVKIFTRLAREMGPSNGKCQLFGSEQTTSPLFAALVNGAASHVVEQDDLHNSSILHPATVVFPPIFALAQSNPDISGQEFLTAAAVGYECGIRVGEFMGRSHYRVFHMTGTVGTVAAAMAAGRLLRLDKISMGHALGSAGTQAAGLWEFLRDAADSKQLHTAKASADGLLAATTANYGLTAATHILDGDKGMAKGMLGEGETWKLEHLLGKRWALTETSFKYHASCRHTHPAADALLKVCCENNLHWEQITRIKAYVYQAAMDVLGAVDIPESIHQSKFSMGFVLALIARYRSASVNEFSEEALRDPVNSSLREKVEMIFDAEIDRQYPEKWCSKVIVETTEGGHFECMVDTPKGDPGNMLSQFELELKFEKLARYSGTTSDSLIRDLIDSAWNLPNIDSFSRVFVTRKTEK